MFVRDQLLGQIPLPGHGCWAMVAGPWLPGDASCHPLHTRTHKRTCTYSSMIQYIYMYTYLHGQYESKSTNTQCTVTYAEWLHA